MHISIVIFISIMVLLLVALIFLLILNQWKTKLKKGDSSRLKKHKGKFQLIPTSTVLRIYKKLDHNFISRQSVRKLNTKLMELGIFDYIQSRVQATKIFIISTTIMTATFFFGLFAFKDLFMGIMMLTFGFIIKDVILKKTIDKYYFKMLEQLADAVSELRQTFMRTGSVADALAELLPGPLLVRQFAKIAEILSSEDAEHKLEEFYATAPIKVLQTLAGICYAVDDGGDTILRDGTSNFINSLSYVTDEINMEIRKLALQKDMFGPLEFLPLIPLIILAPLSNFMGKTIPGTRLLYNGTYGYTVRIVIVLTALFGYMVISKINSAVAIEFDDRPVSLSNLLNKKKWRRLVRIIIPTNEKQLLKKMGQLRGSLSRLTLEHLYMKKAIYAISAFCLSTVLMVSAIYLGLAFTVENIEKSSLTTPTKYTAEEEAIIRKLDKDYLKSSTMKEDDVKKAVLEALPRMNESKQTEQVERLLKKKKEINNAGYKFYHLWLALLIAAVAWNAPEMQLKFRKWLIKTESEEDCLQLQTVISILMNTSIDTLDLLDWLAKHSRVHQHILIDAFHEYPSDPEFSLMKLKQRAALPEFKRIVDKMLLTVAQVSIEEAFGNLAQERDHIMRMRENSQINTLKKKRQRMSPISMASLVLVIAFYFIGPIGLVAVTEFITMFKNMPL